MNEISNVLVTVPFPEEQMKKLEQAFAPAKVWILSNKDTEGISKALEHAEVAILNGHETGFRSVPLLLIPGQ